ncbi:hypothetical protein [Bartonella acomydis]|uniref:hypothetical protein n=1 Tax=Bartonella acomydis TaxID=686234 RepID=UPI0031EE5C4A
MVAAIVSLHRFRHYGWVGILQERLKRPIIALSLNRASSAALGFVWVAPVWEAKLTAEDNRKKEGWCWALHCL